MRAKLGTKLGAKLQSQPRARAVYASTNGGGGAHGLMLKRQKVSKITRSNDRRIRSSRINSPGEMYVPLLIQTYACECTAFLQSLSPILLLSNLSLSRTHFFQFCRTDK
ncbi:hypothetical protein POVWA1_005260 [Plasmodium ovale wallikeri]|uniref:Uncharacterized protein n=1 Tax=Plasmodium ovale wallikeri TaxID=864142 RepID=A0A1A8YHN9_PLAOA|nr:hypothetical protein POVWA1_005260 [Plasmodium ovale wallikeri]